MRIGIIAEDRSDVAVVRSLARKLLRTRGNGVGFSPFVGDGCGKLRRKCRDWVDILVRRGCAYVAIVHDLDDEDEEELRRTLEASAEGLGARGTIVLIPVREIEAWLLYDGNAIASAFRKTVRIRVPGNPEGLDDPKRTLGDIIWRALRREYISTKHNELIADEIVVERIRARSFREFPRFCRLVVA